MKRFKELRDLASDIIDLHDYNEAVEIKYEEMRLYAATYKAAFFNKSGGKLSDILDKQISDNITTKYSGLGIKTLEDLLKKGVITQEEYDFCNIKV